MWTSGDGEARCSHGLDKIIDINKRRADHMGLYKFKNGYVRRLVMKMMIGIKMMNAMARAAAVMMAVRVRV